MKWRLLGCLLLLTSCQPKEQQKLVTVNIASEPSTLDPRKTRSLSERTLACMLFEGIMRTDAKGALMTALGEEIEVLDHGTCYLIHLKKALWSNGEPITANDFVRTWKESLDPVFPSSNAYQLFCIKHAKDIKLGKCSVDELGVIARDEQTLEIHLEHPVPYFLELLALPIFFPVQDKVYSGPFSLQSRQDSEEIVLVKNEHYWNKDAVHLAGLSFIMVSEETELKLFERGELDLAGSPLSVIPLGKIPELNERGLLRTAPMLSTFFYRINTEIAPYQHIAIRKALAYAIDRQALIDHVLQGKQTAALRFMPTTSMAFFQDGDVVQAKKLLEQGLQELHCTELPPITLLYLLDEKSHLIAQVIQQQWKDSLGIDVHLESCEPKVYYQRIRNQEYQIAAGSWIGDHSDPENFLEVFKYKDASTNNTGWTNTLYTELLDASDTLPMIKRNEVLHQCEALLLQEMPIIPLYHGKSLYVQNDRLHDVVLSPLGHLDFTWAYIEEGKK